MGGKKFSIGKIFLTLVITIYAISTLYPLIWLVNQSLKTDKEYYLNQFALPAALQLQNYQKAWVVAKFTDYFKNTVFVTSVSVVLILLVTSLAANAFVRFDFFGKKTWTKIILFVMFIPAPVIIFPVYMLVRNIGLTNTYAGLIGPYVCGGIPVAIMILMTAFSAVPREMTESAKIDGCNEYVIWAKIMLPMVVPSLATIAIMNFMSIWNEYLWALVSISDKKMYTLSRGIVEAADKVYTIGYGTVFSSMVIASLPVILLYIIMQKSFVAAITEGSVKG